MASINVLNLSFPGGASNGDDLCAIVFSDQAITAPTSSGWTEFQAGSAGGIFYSASIHTVTTAEIAAATTWNWNLAGFTSKAGYIMYDFANVTAFGTTAITPFLSPVVSMAAPSISATNNEVCFGFWIALNPTGIQGPAVSSPIAGSFIRGELSILTLVFAASGTGPTGPLAATLDVASTGLAVQASIQGAGAHIVSSSGGSIS